MKKFLIIVCIIAVIIFLGYIGKDMDLSKLNSSNTTNNNSTNSSVVTGKNTTNNSKNTTQNTGKQSNNTENNTKNSTENKAENKTENTTNQTSNTTENTTNKPNEENKDEQVKLSDEDKAKELAKKTYGSSDGVYFKVEQVESNGVYIISVRDAETTNAMAWYKVDVKNQTVKE